jgi:hypothetical protein
LARNQKLSRNRLLAMPVSYLARNRVLLDTIISLNKIYDRGPTRSEVVRSGDAVMSAGEAQELKRWIRALERVLGRKTVENEVFAETVKLAQEKKPVPRAPAARGRFPMKAVARTLGIRSDLERRFENIDGFPHNVEWLSDNGSCYTAAETTAFAESLGLISCFTQLRGP